MYYAICVKPDSTIEIRLDLDESYEFFELRFKLLIDTGTHPDILGGMGHVHVVT